MEEYLRQRNAPHRIYNEVIEESLCLILFAPVTRVKTLIQTQYSHPGLKPESHFKTCRAAAISIFKNQGVQGFWRGALFPVLTLAPFFALGEYFRLYKDYYTLINREKHPYFSLIEDAAKMATFLVFSGSIVYPLATVSVHLMMDTGDSKTKEYQNIKDCLKKITVRPLEIYRGFLFTQCLPIFLVGQSLEMAKKFVDYMIYMPQYYSPPAITCILIGTSIGFSTIFYPIETIRHRLMIQAGRDNQLHVSTIDCIVKIIMKEGIRGFFKGYSMHCLYVMLGMFLSHWYTFNGDLN